jgi:hypothetical protein
MLSHATSDSSLLSDGRMFLDGSSSYCNEISLAKFESWDGSATQTYLTLSENTLGDSILPLPVRFLIDGSNRVGRLCDDTLRYGVLSLPVRFLVDGSGSVRSDGRVEDSSEGVHCSGKIIDSVK